MSLLNLLTSTVKLNAAMLICPHFPVRKPAKILLVNGSNVIHMVVHHLDILHVQVGVYGLSLDEEAGTVHTVGLGTTNRHCPQAGLVLRPPELQGADVLLRLPGHAVHGLHTEGDIEVDRVRTHKTALPHVDGLGSIQQHAPEDGNVIDQNVLEGGLVGVNLDVVHGDGVWEHGRGRGGVHAVGDVHPFRCRHR
ncbi:MAG: hypothetical protein [Caudoviricetes sp.]|nr:MAG: hypothetical protein [Caudoviricetes sp.]